MRNTWIIWYRKTNNRWLRFGDRQSLRQARDCADAIRWVYNEVKILPAGKSPNKKLTVPKGTER
jgi:hypothetical protein